MRFLIWSAATILFLVSCGETSKKIKKDFQPTAGGDFDQIILVMDSTQWKSDLGESLKTAVASAKPSKAHSLLYSTYDTHSTIALN